MTATIEQVPDRADVNMVAGDKFSFTVDFDTDMTGYTFTAKRGLEPLTVAATDLAAGIITVSITGTQSEAWTRGRIGWWLAGTVGTDTRTYLTGTWNIKGRA